MSEKSLQTHQNINQFLTQNFSDSAKNLNRLATNQELISQISTAAQMIIDTYLNGGAIFVAGNGGSAADAQHMVAELVSKLNRDRTPLKAFALTVDTSILTAVGNDYGYDYVFSRQVEGLMGPKDLFLGITTSGNSPNILKALEVCKQKGFKNILLTGKDGGKAKPMAQLTLIAPGDHTAQIQEAHIVIYHNLCWIAEKILVEKGFISYR